MASPESMIKKDLVKAYRELQQELKILKKQLGETKDESGEVKGDLSAPVFFFDEENHRFITAIAKVGLGQLTEVQQHEGQRHMAEQRVLMYCEDTMYNQILEKGE